MKVVLFKNVIGEYRPSMIRYGNEICDNMLGNTRDFTIKAANLPFVKYFLHKEFIYPFIAAKNQGDVNHILDHSYAGLIRFMEKKKTIITCHDLSPLDFPEERARFHGLRCWLNLRLLPCANRIIAVSEATKRSILKHFDYPEDRIHVIYCGVSGGFKVLGDRDGLRRKYGINSKAVMHVGGSWPRKNVEIILRFLRERKDITLIKVGPFSDENRDYISKHDLGDRIIHMGSGESDDEQLAELYNAADVTLMPSFYEGFGLPVAEAMACGCPVICSDIDVFREVGGDAVIFVDPWNVQDLATKADVVFKNTSLRNDMAKKGIERAKKFRWGNSAKETYKIYEMIYDEAKN
ncbi:glycosyltransferase family 4 protein [Candidatus Omnitrophota bacterium]